MNLELLAASLGLLFAGVVKGAVGFGLPMIAAPVLAHFVGARTAVVVMSLVNLLSALLVVSRVRGAAVRPHARVLAPLGLASIGGIVIGAQLLAVLNQTILNALVGTTAVLFALLSAVRVQPKVPPAQRTPIGVLVGFGAGLLGGTTSVFATPIVLFIHALELSKRDFVVLLNLILASSTVVQIFSYWRLGLYTAETLQVTALAALGVAAGVLVGLGLQTRVNQRAFNGAVMGVIFVVGLALIVRALAA